MAPWFTEEHSKSMAGRTGGTGIEEKIQIKTEKITIATARIVNEKDTS